MKSNGAVLKALAYGQRCTPYNEWIQNFDNDHFLSLVVNGIKPIIENNNYFIVMNNDELAYRISYWAWEVFASVRTDNHIKILSLKEMRDHKTKEQYVNFSLAISTTEWNEIFDNWETDYLFNAVNMEGSQQRNTLPDFLWKLIRDENTYSDDDDDDDAHQEKPKAFSINDLGWVTNNRRNF